MQQSKASVLSINCDHVTGLSVSEICPETIPCWCSILAYSIQLIKHVFIWGCFYHGVSPFFKPWSCRCIPVFKNRPCSHCNANHDDRKLFTWHVKVLERLFAKVLQNKSLKGLNRWALPTVIQCVIRRQLLSDIWADSFIIVPLARAELFCTSSYGQLWRNQTE